jgi:hypothetical protein
MKAIKQQGERRAQAHEGLGESCDIHVCQCMYAAHRAQRHCNAPHHVVMISMREKDIALKTSGFIILGGTSDTRLCLVNLSNLSPL